MTLLVALLLAAEPAAARHATVPLDEWERLRKLDERPSLTVVDLLRVEGSFARRDLTMSLSGRSAGALPTTQVLTADGLRLHSCDGDAIVSRQDSGAFAVTPLAPRFRVRCRVALDGSDRLEATTTHAVLEVEAAVRDGELVASAAGAGRSVSIVRAVGGPREELPPTVTGRYHLTLLPDETRFAYELAVRNPSRGHRRFAVLLRAFEHVESVDAPVAWDVEGGTYRFDLPPGDVALGIRGRLTAASFTPPIAASLQYLLLESHPLMRPDVRTTAKRVGVGETGISSAYRGAQAFLLDGSGEVTWTATRLEALKTAGIAVDDLQQVFFLGADGNVRGETTLYLNNQGAPSLALPVTGQPTFASVGGEAAFLTRDAEGRLFVPLAQGTQKVVLQDARPFRHRLGFGFARLDLPRTGVPASRAHVQLRYPAEWIPLYEELAPASRLHLLDGVELFLLAVLVVSAERLLALGGLGRRRRWLLTAALAVLGALSEPARNLSLALVLPPLLALGAALVVRRLSGAARVLALLGMGASLVVLLVGALVAVNVVGRTTEFGSGRMNYAAKLGDERVLQSRPAAAPPATAGAAAYEGLPARIEIPWGARSMDFGREMLPGDAPRAAFALMISARMVAALTTLAGVLAVLVAVALRRDLVDGAHAFAGRFRHGVPAVAHAEGGA